MKRHRLKHQSLIARYSAWCVIIALSIELRTGIASDTLSKTRFDDLVASIDATNLETFESTAGSLSKDQQWLVYKLLAVLSDPKTSNSARSYSAYYLGQVRAARSTNGDRTVDGLAAVISLSYERADQEHILHLHVITKYPAFQALLEIGSPSLPAVVRNLEESDDVLVRDLSLKVLYRVEGDKEIATIRLQRALDAQKDPRKKARLQSALKSLVEMQNAHAP